MLDTLLLSGLIAIIIGVPSYAISVAPRRGVTVGQMIASAFMHLMLWIPLHGVIAVTVGVGLGLLMQSVEVGFLGLIASLIVTSFSRVLQNVKIRYQKRSMIQAKLKGALPRVDYFWEADEVGIGVDSATAKVAVVHGEKLTVSLMTVTDIRHIRAVQSELSELNLIGSASTRAQRDTFAHNLSARQKHVATTGLELEFNDIEYPSVLVPMPYRGAEQWLRVLEQLRNGDLKPNVAPTQLPAA
ncbi:MAG: hypothetical protein ACKOF9_16050 [Burkholderiales bacterium]